MSRENESRHFENRRMVLAKQKLSKFSRGDRWNALSSTRWVRNAALPPDNICACSDLLQSIRAGLAF